MAGHSKWANIKFRKAAQDAKRGKLFTKLIREITVAAKQGGGDPAINPRLRTALDKALAANMTRDTINRSISRGLGNDTGQNLDEVRYEGYGPFGVAIMVDCLTDNRNRTVGEVRHAFTKYGGNLGLDGSVGYLFTLVGRLLVATLDEEKLLEHAINAGAEDVLVLDSACEVHTSPDQITTLRNTLEQAGFSVTLSETTLIPSNKIPLNEEQATTIIQLQDALELLDDVQTVYSNAEIDPGWLAEQE